MIFLYILQIYVIWDLTRYFYSAKVTACNDGKGAAECISACLCRFFYLFFKIYYTVKENAI